MIPLSIIIPVWNDASGLRKLVSQILDYGIAQEIIICDDASEESHDPASLGLDTGTSGVKVLYHRGEAQRGAGAMRNVGLSMAGSPFVLFFDSDDLLRPGIVDLLGQLDGKDFDFCIFRHHDSRITNREGTFESEEKHWRAANVTAEPRLAGPRDAAELVQLSAYPWNKIYRKQFLTSQGVKCTEIPVHNDIELHWTSFIAADTILCSSTIGAEHFVVEGGTRLTNRRGEERLRLFEALDASVERLHGTQNGAIYIEPLLHFCYRIIAWAWNNVDAEHHEALHRKSRVFFMNRFTPDDIRIAAYRNPSLLGKINKILAGGK